MKKQFTLLSLLAAAATQAAAAPGATAGPEARLLRFPATNGRDVVFSYAGDLYTAPLAGGEARRLTSHIGNEIFPRFSPDGRQIAFTGQYDGNTEVYLMDARGGEPRRITYTSTNSRDDLGDRMGPNNITMGWAPDGTVVYRNRIGDGFDGQLWKAPTDGSMPTRIPLPEGGFCSFSPDGKRMAYNRVMREFRTWKYYRGGMADDIWIYDPAKGTVTNITSNPAQDIAPMWIGDEIFFISDRDMTMNLFAYNTLTGKTEKVTDFTDFDIKFPSSDGHTIVFEKGGYIYAFNPATRQSRKIDITLAADNVYARPQQQSVADRITNASPSPAAERMAVTARGEVFDVPAAGKGVTRNITRTPGAHDRAAVWSPDGKSIAYISDATGETEIWLKDADGSTPRQLTKGNDTYIRALQWTPDSRRIIYTDRKNRVVSVDPASGAKTVLFTNPEHEMRGIAVSPDSRWIAYSRSGANQMGVIYVRSLADGKEYPVTEKWYDSSSPIFSSDGRYLIFTSERDFNPTYGQLEWNHVYNNMGGIYMAMLAADTPSPLLPEDEKLSTDTDKPAKSVESVKSVKSAESAKPQPAPTVTIDPEGLPGRIVKLPLQAGNYRPVYSDGKTVWYSSRRSTRAFDLAKAEDNAVADAMMIPAADGKHALYIIGEKIYTGPLSASKVKLEKPVDLSDMVAVIDYPAEWAQIFNETWRAYRDGFYLENMHGVDWKAIHDKYAALLPWVKTRLDLNYLIGEMISELACGHAYVNPGEKPEAPRVSMGLLGADISRVKGGYRIDAILEGAPYSKELVSPLAQPGTGVKAGDVITAIDGIATDTVANIQTLLAGKAGVLTELTIAPAGSTKAARKVVVKPLDNEYPLRHLQWVRRNIDRVDKATDGRVGYIYIPDMGPEGLNEFARYFYPQLDKEALIIDDRANGGGNVSPMIIERLMRRPYRMTMRRGSNLTGTVPDGSHTGPKVLLINKYSASDGDLFPWSFKANKLGTVVGTRTWGGIIGISGSLPYMDGTDVRVPFFTNYDAATGQWIVENHGVDPDILIDNDPVKEEAGIDQQLDKAIQVALDQLKDRKPLPPVPAPRTFKSLGL